MKATRLSLSLALVVIVLCTVAILVSNFLLTTKVENVSESVDKLSESPKGSGQIFKGPDIEIELHVGETHESWRRRYDKSVEAFRGVDGSGGE